MTMTKNLGLFQHTHQQTYETTKKKRTREKGTKN